MSGNLSNSVNKKSIKVFVASFGRKFKNLLQLSELSDFLIVVRVNVVCKISPFISLWIDQNIFVPRQTILIKNSDFEIFYNEKTFFDDLLNECNRDEIIPLSSHSYNNVCMRLENRKLSPTHTYYKHLVSSSTLKSKNILWTLNFWSGNRFIILEMCEWALLHSFYRKYYLIIL